MASRRPADWRFPTEKQQRVEDIARRLQANASSQRTDEDCWWDSVINDPRSHTQRPSPARTLSSIQSDVLRVDCLRCMRIVEIMRDQAIKLYGADATWKSVGQKLLDNGCEYRTGSHETDGCWPDFRNR